MFIRFELGFEGKEVTYGVKAHIEGAEGFAEGPSHIMQRWYVRSAFLTLLCLTSH